MNVQDRATMSDEEMKASLQETFLIWSFKWLNKLMINSQISYEVLWNPILFYSNPRFLLPVHTEGKDNNKAI